MENWLDRAGNAENMTNLTYYLGAFFLVLFLLLAPATKAQSTHTAASCNESDVNAVINGPTHTAVNGDIIQIPSGTCTWTSNLNAPSGVGFTLIGSGTPQSGAGVTGASSSCTATRILDNAGSLTHLMAFSPIYGSSSVRVSCMAIDPAISGSLALYAPIGINGTCSSSGCPSFRVDNITFGFMTRWTENNNGSQAAAMIRMNNAFGVLDHNTAPSGSNVELFVAHLQNYLGVGDYGDESWAQPNSLGGADNVFAENNLWNTQIFAINDCEAPLPYGCRFVDRYNTVTQTSSGSWGIAQNHGTDTTGRGRSGREMEVYGNTLNCQSNCSGVEGGTRGGTGMYFNNHANLTPGQGANTWLGMSLYRNVDSNTNFGYCGGNGPWDRNDGSVYYSGTVGSVSNGGLTMTDSSKSFSNLVPVGAPYSIYDVTQGFVSEITSNTGTTITIMGSISESTWSGISAGDRYQITRATICIDQEGRGQGNYLSGASTTCGASFTGAINPGPSPCGWPSEAEEPIYQWGDSFSGGANVNRPISSGSGRVINYRDYYAQASGVQTSSSSPFACDGNSGGTGWGTLANRPATCGGACSTNTPGCGYFATDQGSQGTLYAWESGAWATYYQPYTYPHPLTTGGSVSGPPPPGLNPPQGLTATVQ
jgi:hypothetical protein